MFTSHELRIRRRDRQRYKISQTSSGRPRLSVHRTGCHMYAQVIDTQNGTVIASASTLTKDLRSSVKNGGNKEAASSVGKLIALRAIEKGVREVVFDRSGFLYHGRVKALADSARENGLVF